MDGRESTPGEGSDGDLANEAAVARGREVSEADCIVRYRGRNRTFSFVVLIPAAIVSRKAIWAVAVNWEAVTPTRETLDKMWKLVA